MSRPTDIRRAGERDHDAIWAMLEPILRAGETYALPRDWGREEAMAYWFGEGKWTFVYEQGGGLLGSYYLKANQMGGGDHVCNCGYITAEAARGRGVASAMCEHSLLQAQELGFRAMQYNLVVSTNASAVRLWQRFGFEIVGTLSSAFHHPSQGDVDAHVMYRWLSDASKL